MSLRVKRKDKLRFDYVFSNPKIHPFEQIDWDEYGLNRGIALRKLINRVVKKYSETGKKEGYFATIKDQNIFERELIWLLLNQAVLFEKEVWFTVGKGGLQKTSKNAIIGVEDGSESRFNCFTNIVNVLKSESNVGVNLSKIRSFKEGQSTSGPVEFLQLVDSLTQNFTYEKLFILDIDHPDIFDFIRCSYNLTNPETKICTRVSDEFMKSVENDTDFNLRSRKTGESVEAINARELFNEIILASSSNSNFSLQFDSTINSWQTTSLDGKISASSSSEEFFANDFLECPRIAIDILKFIDGEKFDFEKYISAIELAVTALDMSINFSDFSIAYISSRTKKFRPIGVSFINLDAALKQFQLHSNSKSARVLGAAIANLTSAVAYRRSSELAVAVKPQEQLKANLSNQVAIVKKHYEKSLKLTDEVVDEMDFAVNINELLFAANLEWDIALEFGKKHGFRNCQLTSLTSGDDFIFDKSKNKKDLKPIDQIKMLSELQSFITGGIGLPIYLNSNENTKTIEELCVSAWKYGLKSITFYKK